jgi:hypothetical protein
MSNQDKQNKLEVDLTPLLVALGLVRPDFVGYHPCPNKMPAVPEADDVDNEHGLSPELRRHLRVERRDAVLLARLATCHATLSKLEHDVDAFVKASRKFFDAGTTSPDAQAKVFDVWMAHERLIREHGLERCERKPEEVAPSRFQQGLDAALAGAKGALQNPEIMARISAALASFGWQLVPVTVAAPAAAPAEAPKEPVVTPPPAKREDEVAASIGFKW